MCCPGGSSGLVSPPGGSVFGSIMTKQSVSLKDIARRCGVSVATVSKALNDQSDIGAETKELVRQAARDMGYSPNSAARSLKMSKTDNIGVLFTDEARSGLTHDYFATVLDAFKRCAESQGYDITFINANRSRVNRMSYLEHARYRGFDGVVIACVNFSDPEVRELIESELPVVTIDHIFQGRISVHSDNVDGIRQLVTYCYSQGHRKIAYIHGLPSAVTIDRISSFYRTTEMLGIHVPDEYMVPVAYRDSVAAREATVRLLDLPDPPTCILFPDDYSALGGINELNARGLKIGKDIAIAGYDGITITRITEPALCTVQQDMEGIGRVAAEKLIELISHPRTTLIESIVMPVTLVKGMSVQELKK